MKNYNLAYINQQLILLFLNQYYFGYSYFVDSYFGDSNFVALVPVGDLKKYNFLSINPIINSSVLMKKELACWNSYFDSVEDYELWIRLWKQNYKFYNIKTILTLHRIHNKSHFNSKINQRKLLQELLSN